PATCRPRRSVLCSYCRSSMSRIGPPGCEGLALGSASILRNPQCGGYPMRGARSPALSMARDRGSSRIADMSIHDIQADHYLIPLPVPLSDSTHGTIRAFELITARVRDTEGAEGLGYTYTVGAGGAAVHAILARDLAPLLVGRDAERIEEIWNAMWWALHYGGRGGARARAPSPGRPALRGPRARRPGAPPWRPAPGVAPPP